MIYIRFIFDFLYFFIFILPVRKEFKTDKIFSSENYKKKE